MKVTFKIGRDNKPLGARDSQGNLYPPDIVPPLNRLFHEHSTFYSGFYVITEGNNPRIYNLRHYLDLAPDELIKVHIPQPQLANFPELAGRERGIYFRAVDVIPLDTRPMSLRGATPAADILGFVRRDNLPEDLENANLGTVRLGFTLAALTEAEREAFFEAEDYIDIATNIFCESTYYQRPGVGFADQIETPRAIKKKPKLKPRPEGICSSRELRNTEVRFVRCIRSLEPLRIKGKVYSVLPDGSYIVDGIPTFAKNKVFVCLSPIEEYFINPQTGEFSISTKALSGEVLPGMRPFNVDSPIHLNENLKFNIEELNQFTEVHITETSEREVGTRIQVKVRVNSKAKLDIPYSDEMSFKELTDIIEKWDSFPSLLMKNVRLDGSIGNMANKISDSLSKHYKRREELAQKDWEEKVKALTEALPTTDKGERNTYATSFDGFLSPDEMEFIMKNYEFETSNGLIDKDTNPFKEVTPKPTTGEGFEMHMLKARGAGFNHTSPAGYTRRVKRNKKKGGW